MSHNPGVSSAHATGTGIKRLCFQIYRLGLFGFPTHSVSCSVSLSLCFPSLSNLLPLFPLCLLLSLLWCVCSQGPHCWISIPLVIIVLDERSVNCANWKWKVDVVFVALFAFHLKAGFSYSSDRWSPLMEDVLCARRTNHRPKFESTVLCRVGFRQWELF